MTGAISRLLARAAERGLDTTEIERCAHWAEQAHEGQMRRSGVPYISHPLEVAGLCADLGAGLAAVLAALLHDTVEDTPKTLKDVETDFGIEVARLVDGCTKVAIVHPQAGSAQQQAANLRKLFVAMAEDPRVVLVKLCDRLHNLRTIGALPAEKARRIGEETLAVHGPLAHRMGLAGIKAELEDRAWAAADPESHRSLALRVAESDLYPRLAQAQMDLEAHLRAQGHEIAVTGRVKHLWSMHNKAQRYGRDPLELPDVLGLRVFGRDEEHCFDLLAGVHALWEPDLTRLRDYISRPKPNGYQSLHTTVDTPHGILEVQLRTPAMHDAAEHGTASHHGYKHGLEPVWMDQLLDPSSEVSDEDFVDEVHAMLDTRRDVLVLTPKGEVKELPEGSCVIDFAYAVHTAVGDRCVGGRIDGRIVPLHTRLQSGQIVEIITGDREGPAIAWLAWVATPKARGKIRAFHAKTVRENTPPPPVVEPVRRIRRRALPRRSSTDETLIPAVAGLGSISIGLAGCCKPMPGEAVTGVVNRSRVTVHINDCSAVTAVGATEPGKTVPVYWIGRRKTLMELSVQVADRPGLHTSLVNGVTGAGGEVLDIRRRDHSTVALIVVASAERQRAVREALRLLAGVRSVY